MKKYNGKYAIFSFDPFIINWFRKNEPTIIRGQISGEYKNPTTIFLIRFLLKNMIFNFITKPDFISYDINYIPNKKLDKLQKKGITIICYSAKNQNDFNKAKKYYSNTVFEGFHPSK